MAMRVPDHGKLAPWRFIHVAQEDRRHFAEQLKRAYCVDRAIPTSAECAAIDQFAHQAPTLILVLSTPRHDRPIPSWEQELSAGAACYALLAAAHAHGFVGCWLTGWAAYSPRLVAELGYPTARIAGFLFIGSPGEQQKERPRPAYDDHVQTWRPPT